MEWRNWNRYNKQEKFKRKQESRLCRNVHLIKHLKDPL